MDDVIVHRLGEDDYMLVINAGTREKDVNWVTDNTRQFDCKVENLSDNYTQIAIQGPKGVDTLQKLTDADLSKVKFYWFTHGTVCGLPNILIARTGYTAEDGFEIYVPTDEATSARVWNAVMEAGKEFGIVPCGLGARNTLRLEGRCRSTGMRFPTPSMCGKLAWIASSRWRRANSSAVRRWSAPRPTASNARWLGWSRWTAAFRATVTRCSI